MQVGVPFFPFETSHLPPWTETVQSSPPLISNWTTAFQPEAASGLNAPGSACIARAIASAGEPAGAPP